MTPRIASLGHVGIFVDDVDRSLRFYRDLLGLTPVSYTHLLAPPLRTTSAA